MALSINKSKLDNLATDIWKSAERLRGKFKDRAAADHGGGHGSGGGSKMIVEVSEKIGRLKMAQITEHRALV